ncbi:DNA polymerase II, partial [Pseudomonas sp. MOB-449]|nr:DNA polymerase II [Pseudomonas sp. MOB-449]
MEVEFWLATDAGPRRVRVPVQPAVAFVPAEQRRRAEQLLKGEADAELRELELRDFHHRPVLGLYCRQYAQLLRLEKVLRAGGVDVY